MTATQRTRFRNRTKKNTGPQPKPPSHDDSLDGLADDLAPSKKNRVQQWWNDRLSPEAQTEIRKASNLAVSWLLGLGLFVLVIINWIPYNLAFQRIFQIVPGLSQFLASVGLVVEPVSLVIIGVSVYHMLNGLLVSANKRNKGAKRSFVPFLGAGTAVIVAIVAQITALDMFIAASATIAAALVLYFQFAWILFEADEKRVASAIAHENNRGEVEDEQLKVATRSEREALHAKSNSALVVDYLVSAWIYPPIPWANVAFAVLTLNPSLISAENIGMMFLTTIAPGKIFRLMLKG